MEGGDLRQALSSPEAPERYHWNHLGQHVALDVVRGLHFLHRNKVPCAFRCPQSCGLVCSSVVDQPQLERGHASVVISAVSCAPGRFSQTRTFQADFGVRGCQVVHSDLKSRNVLLGRDGITAKLSDVGMSRILSGSRSAPVPGDVPGTFPYAAPELLLGQSCTVKADIFR